MWKVSDFSTSVMWRNLTFLTWQMWRIFRFFHICYVWESNISPHDKFFSTYLICEICDKYEVWVRESCLKEKPQGHANYVSESVGGIRWKFFWAVHVGLSNIFPIHCFILIGSGTFSCCWRENLMWRWMPEPPQDQAISPLSSPPVECWIPNNMNE